MCNCEYINFESSPLDFFVNHFKIHLLSLKIIIFHFITLAGSTEHRRLQLGHPGQKRPVLDHTIQLPNTVEPSNDLGVKGPFVIFFVSAS